MIRTHRPTIRQARVPGAQRSLAAALLLLALGSFAGAQTDSPVQASARPFGLDIAAPVDTAGSDAGSAAFDANTLPSVQSFLSATLPDRRAEDDTKYAFDPSKLLLTTESDVRVYFLGESAGFANSIGFNAGGVGVRSGDPKLIFPNASSNLADRTAQDPLLAGDFVDLGTFGAGTSLDFFLVSNGANGGSDVFSTTGSANPDGINHVVAFSSPDSPYLIFGFEDLFGGGDRDFNDVMFAIDIRRVNANAPALRALTAAPEPALYLTLGSFLLVAFAWKRRLPRFAA